MKYFCTTCGEEFSPKRAELGYRTCLQHGEKKLEVPIIPVAKSNYIVGSMEELKQGSQSHKGASNYG